MHNNTLSTTDLAQISDPALRKLASLGRLQRFAPHTLFINEGDLSDAAYVMLHGRVKVFASEPDGSEIVLNICGAGECIGEMALDGGTRSASVITLEAVTCSVISRAALRESITQEPDFALQLIALLIGRARLATDKIKGLALHGVYERITHLLLGLAQERDGVWVVSEPLSQQEIAHRVGASRDMVSRVLKELLNGGHIRIERKIITLLKKLPAHW